MSIKYTPIDLEEVDPRQYIKCLKCNDNGCLVIPCKCNIKVITKDDINKFCKEVENARQEIKHSSENK